MKPAGAWLSIVALFVSGVAIGAVGMQLFGGADEQESRRPPWVRDGGSRHGEPRQRDRPGQFLIEHLDLNDTQAGAVRDVLRESADRARRMRETWRPQIEAHLDETRRQIDELLTDEQRTRLEEMASGDSRRMERMLLGGPPTRRRGRGGPRGRPGGDAEGRPPADPPPGSD